MTTDRCITEISVEERPDGFFVKIVVNGATEAERGPMEEDAATLLADVLAKRAAQHPSARTAIFSPTANDH